MDVYNHIWVIIHSGSRGVGHAIATHYMKLAKEISIDVDYSELDVESSLEFYRKNKRWILVNPDSYAIASDKYVKSRRPKVDKMLDGHYGLSVYTKEGKDYIQDLNWCLDYALSNRKEMMQRVRNIIEDVTNKTTAEGAFINKNHNHVVLADNGLWIHRKGATQADKDMPGVIPGNMRDGSFIVKGLGNTESLCSSSHGAGRVLGRKEAKRKLSLETFKNTMQHVKGKVDEDTLDESPEAYKDIFEVMKLQEDMVKVVNYIKPLINIKG